MGGAKLVQIIYDPSGIFTGGEFNRQDFAMTLQAGVWTPGMQIAMSETQWTVKIFTYPLHAGHRWIRPSYRAIPVLRNGKEILALRSYSGSRAATLVPIEELGYG